MEHAHTSTLTFTTPDAIVIPGSNITAHGLQQQEAHLSRKKVPFDYIRSGVCRLDPRRLKIQENFIGIILIE